MADVFIPIINRNASTLPLVLVGPILRRVESNRVSVFVVLSKPVDNIRLEVMTDLNQPNSTTPLKGTVNSIPQIGDYLYATVVTAKPTGTINLVGGKIYHYNLFFTINGVAKSLNDHGILVWPADGTTNPRDVVAYGDDEYPSFVAPVNTINELRLIHGSCRKPHGGEIDGMTAIDSIISCSYRERGSRPQLLFLTGDQIYADDVSDVVSYMCAEMMPKLMGYTETLPGKGRDALTSESREALMRSVGFTCFDGDGKNHSIRLADFIGLYLLAWSDVFWPATLPPYSQAGTKTTEKEFGKERAAVTVYRKSASSVRKVLANVSVLMMFDDHDVCDDWFLNQDWTNNVYGSSGLGKRVIQNGLSAFAIFQAWGNTPDRFEAGDGLDILNGIAQCYQDEKANRTANWNEIGAKILPRKEVFGTGYVELKGGMRWDYSIRYGKYMVMALNTRTNRSFNSRFAGASLLSNVALSAQIDSSLSAFAGAELLVLVSGTPVFGHPLVEEFVQPACVVHTNLAPLVKTWPSKAGSEGGRSKWDYEAWKFSKATFEELLHRLGQFENILILSGDVHYGFTGKISYWDKRKVGNQELDRRAVFVQLTASSMKNSDTMTQLLPVAKMSSSEVVGWKVDAGSVAKMGPFVKTKAANKTYTLYTTFLGTLYKKPEWEYRIDFLRDARPIAQRGTPNEIGLPAWVGPSLDALEAAALATLPSAPILYPAVKVAQYHREMLIDHERQIVGLDNIGYVSFNWSSTNKSVKHVLWTNPTGSKKKMIGYSVHSAAFVLGTLPSSKITKTY